jgi:hypothetical protein
MLTEANRQSRGKALEEAFFFRMDQELIELLGKRMQRDEKMRSFANATGIQDKKRLASLIDAGFELSTLTAFIWVPLVFVAWADGHADQQERKAICDVLAGKGISPPTVAMMIDHDWFHHCPSEELWKTWEDFVAASMTSLNPLVRNELIDEIVGLCHVVAHASGGFLGIGKISPTETEVIDRVIGSLHRCSGPIGTVS